MRLWEADSVRHLRTLRPDGPYERMNITELTRVSEVQRVALLALVAVVMPASSRPS